MSHRFNPPPGWPTPPADWVPPEGWQPDPSWPPAPKDWQWWSAGSTEVSDPRPRELHPPRERSPDGSWFEQWREKRGAHRLERKVELHKEDLKIWQTDRDGIAELIEAAQTFRGSNHEDTDGFVLQRGETAYLVLRGAVLIEPQRAPGHYQGGYSGFSFRIAKGVSYRVGGMRGHYVPGPEAPAVVDSGDVLVSSKRVVFRGPLKSREWTFAKLTSVENSDSGSWTNLSVSNRQKPSGFGYTDESADVVRFRLALALAVWNDTVPQLVDNLERQLAEHDAQKPVDPDATQS